MGYPLINEEVARVIQQERRQAANRHHVVRGQIADRSVAPGAVRRLTGQAMIQIGHRLAGTSQPQPHWPAALAEPAPRLNR